MNVKYDVVLEITQKAISQNYYELEYVHVPEADRRSKYLLCIYGRSNMNEYEETIVARSLITS